MSHIAFKSYFAYYDYHFLVLATLTRTMHVARVAMRCYIIICRAVVVDTVDRYQWQGLWTGMHAYATKELDSWAVSRRVDGKGAFQTNVTWNDGKNLLH